MPQLSFTFEPHKYVAFDIEIAKSIPEGMEDWKSLRPLGISCAATLSSDGELQRWHGTLLDGSISDQMSQSEAAGLVRFLQKAVQSGATILTWNGLGFDFDILAEESNLFDACRDLAWKHLDLMFHIFCLKGFPLALDKAAKGMNLAGKTAGMSGEMAPRLWAEGKRQEVLEYVSQDVRTTLEVALAVENQHELRWTSNTGKPLTLPLPDGWLTVEQALQLPEPDNSWMKTPWRRTRFMKWMKENKRITF